MPRPKGSGNKNKSELIELALAGIDAQISQLQAQIQALVDKRKQIAKPGTASAATASATIKVRKGAASVTAKKKRVVSPATRKKLKEAAKARWARERSEEEK